MVIWGQLLNTIVCYFLLFIVLSTWWKFNFNISIESFNLYFWPKDCLWYAQIEVSMNVMAFSLEVIMRPYFHIYYKISVWATHSSMTFLWYTQINSSVNSFRYVYSLFYLTMYSAFTSTCDAWCSYNSTNTITNSTNLLYHEGSLLNGLKSLSTTAATYCWWCTWLGLGTLTSSTNISPAKTYLLWYTIYCFHEVNFHIHHYVLAFCLDLLSSLPSAFTTKHLLKFFEYISETPLGCSSSFIELTWESIKTCKALAKWITSSRKWVFSPEWGLSLLITSHTSLVINSPFVIITESLICVVDFTEFFFCLWSLVHVRMILFC